MAVMALLEPLRQQLHTTNALERLNGGSAGAEGGRDVPQRQGGRVTAAQGRAIGDRRGLGNRLPLSGDSGVPGMGEGSERR